MAEGARLESVFRVKPNEGSNPSLSAKFNTNPLIFIVGFFILPTNNPPFQLISSSYLIL